MTGTISSFIALNLELRPVPSLPAICLYSATPHSRLSRLADPENTDPPAPYWAFQWAGGLALAHHIMAHPQGFAGRRILDLGAGSGLVGIAAAKAGALVSAAEIDPNARAAIALNAAANGVSLPLLDLDIAGPAPQGIDMILGGDVFYREEVAQRMLPFLVRCAAAGMEVLIGDPGRRDLPNERLTKIASYPVSDVGDPRDTADREGMVYRLRR